MLTSRAYVGRGGVRCPVCGSTNITGGPISANFGTAQQDILCQDCESSWTDIYRLAFYENLERGNKKKTKRAEGSAADRGD